MIKRDLTSNILSYILEIIVSTSRHSGHPLCPALQSYSRRSHPWSRWPYGAELPFRDFPCPQWRRKSPNTANIAPGGWCSRLGI